MASSREFLEFILDQLSVLDGITYKMMMGEYIIYYDGKIIGGIYDDRFLVKKCEASMRLMPEAEAQLPYEGGREMLTVSDIDNREFLRELFDEMYVQLPLPKKKK